MEKFQELPTNKVIAVLSGSPNLTRYPWLLAYPCNPNDFFTNPVYLNKLERAELMLSGGAVYSVDAIRLDGNSLDRDRRLINLSGGQMFMQTSILKSFAEHHSQ